MSPTCTCSPSIPDPLCLVREHQVMAKAVAVTRDFLGQKKMAVSFAPAVITPIDFYPPPYVQQEVSIDFGKPCTCPSIAADPLCPIEEHRALAAPGDGQPLAPDATDAEWKAAVRSVYRGCTRDDYHMAVSAAVGCVRLARGAVNDGDPAQALFECEQAERYMDVLPITLSTFAITMTCRLIEHARKSAQIAMGES